MSRLYDYLVAPAVQTKRYWDAKKETLIAQNAQSQLEVKHLSNTQLFPDRKTLISNLKNGAVAAEIGVASGDFSQIILETNPPQEFHLIDMWADYRKAHGVAGGDILRNIIFRRNAKSSLDSVMNRFQKQIENRQIKLHRGLSWSILEQFNDNTFDWIYIDAGHDFKSVCRDLETARKKMKPDGIIAGHDYVRWGRQGVRYGVVEAVNSFCINFNFELVMLSLETKTNASWAIRKI